PWVTAHTKARKKKGWDKKSLANGLCRTLSRNGVHNRWRLLERQLAHPLHQISVRPLCINKNMPLIDLMKLPVAHQYLAIDHHGLHIASLDAVNKLAEDVIHRLIVNRVDIDEDQIRSFADF